METISSEKEGVERPLLPMAAGPMAKTGDVPFAIGGPPAGPKVNSTPSTSSVKSGPLTVSTGVSAGLLLSPIQPVYPQIARMTRIEGVVVIQAIISKQGRIESARLVSGPPMLAQAALDAVKNARYRPYMLNNEPTEVETTFSVNFRLSN
jgi:protein TonB